MKEMKRIASIMVILTILLAFFTGCTNATKEPAQSTGKTEPVSSQATVDAKAKLFDEPTTLSILIPNVVNNPYQENWYIIKKIKEWTNVTLDVTTAPSTNYDDKLAVMVAGGTLPDMVYIYGAEVYNKYGADKQLVNILDYKDDLPNFTQWYSKNEKIASGFLSVDGALYVFPNAESGDSNKAGWLYREDIFKKNNLEKPKTQDELYSVLKKLKEIYPDSYPYAWRNGLYTLYPGLWGSSLGYYYDFTSGQSKYGPVEPGFKEMVTFLNKLYTDGLMTPDVLTVNTKSYVDQISNDKGFVSCDMLGRIDFFNNAIRPTNKDFSWVYMGTFKANGPTGSDKQEYTGIEDAGVAITALSKHIKESLRFRDWGCSDEGRALTSWGQEGETYTVTDGKKVFKPEIKDSSILKKDYGIFTNGLYTAFDYDACLALSSKELSYAIEQARLQEKEYVCAPKYTSDEMTELQMAEDPIRTHMEESISKFIIGKRPLSEWDAYVKEIDKLGLQEVLKKETVAAKRSYGK